MDKAPAIASVVPGDSRDSPREASVAKRRRKRAGRSLVASSTAAIDMRPFSILLGQVMANKGYEVLLKRKRTWKRAFLLENSWVTKSGLFLGRVEDTVDIRIAEREVMATIDWLAGAMTRGLETNPDPGTLQHYFDRDVLDGVHDLLGDIDFDHPTPQQLSICRAIRLAAMAKAMPSMPHSEIAVGYRVTDDADNTMFDSLNLEDALLYIHDNREACRKDVGVVFADGSVCYGHELSRRPWIAGPDDFIAMKHISDKRRFRE